MEAARRAGRIIGALMIVQMVGTGMVNFGLEAPLFAGPGFLVNAASHSGRLGLAVVLGLIAEATWVGVAVTAFPILFERTGALALWLVALAVVGLAVAASESAGVLSMVSLSEAYAKASALEREQLQAVGVVVAAGRNWAHYLGRIFHGVGVFVFYAALSRAGLLPRALGGFGLIAATLMVAGVAMPLFGHDVVFPMLAPLGLCQLIVAVWLMTRGLPREAGRWERDLSPREP